MGVEIMIADGTESFRSSIRLLGVRVALGDVSLKLGLGMPSCWWVVSWRLLAKVKDVAADPQGDWAQAVPFACMQFQRCHR